MKKLFPCHTSYGCFIRVSSLWAQEVPTNTAVPLKSNDYHDAFAPFFYTKMEQQHGPQAVNRVSIGKIEQITFLQLN
jgi:hypothetical protein